MSAKDTRLGRDVAIKVLPDAFARDTERLARFEREARVLASLNHPNIAAIHGFEKSGDVQFLVLELVEGNTLADRLKAGAIPVAETLHIARQIAEGLETAHENGIIHRDLKPANIKVTPDGKVKVLDFGLAKAFAVASSNTDIAVSPTITADFTREGVVLGTAAYMSPEQARGKTLDKRTDIWSFGCVFYECFTGAKPFVGETTSDIIARILEREPDWAPLPPQTPPVVQLLLRRCHTAASADKLDVARGANPMSKAASSPKPTCQRTAKGSPSGDQATTSASVVPCIILNSGHERAPPLPKSTRSRTRNARAVMTMTRPPPSNHCRKASC